MTTIKYVLSISLVLLLIAVYSNAQQPGTTQYSTTVPRLVNFSGKAIDTQGKVIAGVAGITFSIYKDQYEGSPLWMETQNVHADKSGNYTAALGISKSEGLPLELFSSAEGRWLGVRIDGGEEQPRVLLLSVPYALKAADAQTLGGLPPSAFLKATSSGSGPDANASGPPRSGAPAANVTGAGTVNVMAKWVGATQIGNSHVFDSAAGNVGINTTTPTAVLDVNGSARVRGSTTMNGSLAANGITGTSSSGIGVYGSSTTSQAIWGESTATGYSNGSGPDGVHGVTHSSAGSGVGGINWAAGGVGVWGEAPTGYGFYTPNNVQQAHTASGWVKAMAEVNGVNAPYTIERCFNSTLAGSAATTPPCGFVLTQYASGVFIVDFGFEVDDRFLSATGHYKSSVSAEPIAKSQIFVQISSTYDGSLVGDRFDLIIY